MGLLNTIYYKYVINQFSGVSENECKTIELFYIFVVVVVVVVIYFHYREAGTLVNLFSN